MHAPVHRQSVAAFGRGDKKGKGEQISRYPEHWLEGTNVSDIIYDVKCSVSALPPSVIAPLSFSIWGSGKQKRHFLINDGHDDTAGKILRHLQIFWICVELGQVQKDSKINNSYLGLIISLLSLTCDDVDTSKHHSGAQTSSVFQTAVHPCRHQRQQAVLTQQAHTGAVRRWSARARTEFPETANVAAQRAPGAAPVRIKESGELILDFSRGNISRQGMLEGRNASFVGL